jgi:hypothetical protein
MKVEGKEPTSKGMSITSDFLKGNITSQQAIEEIIKYHLGGGNR